MNSPDGPPIPGEAGYDERPTADAEQRSRYLRRQVGVGVLLALVIAAGAFAVVRFTGGDGDDAEPLPPGAVYVDTWAPYWALDDSLPVVEQRLDGMREISPFWFTVGPTLDIVVDEFANADATAAMLEAIDASDVALVPSIRDELPAGDMATVIADTDLRSQHIESIVEFADDIDADGIDIDYEQFAFSDGRDTWADTRPNWVTFVEELAAALDEVDVTLTITIPPIYPEGVDGGGYWVYDHGAIAEHADFIRIMTYDYSVGEVGPIAPVDWVQQSIDGVSEAVAPELHHKLVLGIPTYGYNWVVGTSGDCPASAEGRTTVTSVTALDLAERRGGTPVLDPVNLEWSFSYDLEVVEGEQSCVQTRQVRWVDAEGAGERVRMARQAGWGGVALWALGYDDDEAWAAISSASTEELPVATVP